MGSSPLFLLLTLINHEILFSILAKYGLPAPLIQAIQKLYSNCIVKLELGDEKCDINYGTGVQQGDNMAPIPFLLVMQAFVETLQPIMLPERAEFRHFPNGKGCLIRQ